MLYTYDMYSLLLAVHVVGAMATLIVSCYALIILTRDRSDRFAHVTRMIALLATFELISGAAVAALSPTVTAVSLCDNIALYILLVSVVLGTLRVRMQRTGLQFPLMHSVSSIGVGIMVLGGVAMLGL